MPNDSGPIYLETNMHNFPVELWNSTSNLIFLVIFLYWSYRISFQYWKHKFIGYNLALLFIGYIGGTVYHGTRSHEVWLLMDVVPIFGICLSVAYIYWHKVFRSHSRVLFFIATPYVIFRTVLWQLPLSENAKTSLGYCLLSLVLLPPIFLYSYIQKENNKYILYTSVSIGIAILFRTIDFLFAEQITGILPMGTHWIWHLLGGIACYFGLTYVFEQDLMTKGHQTVGDKIKTSKAA